MSDAQTVALSAEHTDLKHQVDELTTMLMDRSYQFEFNARAKALDLAVAANAGALARQDDPTDETNVVKYAAAFYAFIISGILGPAKVVNPDGGSEHASAG